MCKVCGNASHITVNAALRYDPTRTTILRQRFEAEIVRRFRRLARLIRERVGEEDGFGLKANAGQFDFPRSDQKVGAFMDWLQGQVNEGILEVRVGEALGRASQRAWTNVYIQSAYQKGLAQSASRMRAEGAQVAPEWVTDAFTRPFHADRVGLVYTRTFNDLKGITDEMDKQISRELANGLSQGLGPMDIARSLTDRVEKVGITRARMLARTEVIAAHAEASLNVYEEAEADGVMIEAEFATAGDAQVCQQCRDAAAAGPYSLDKARGMIPLHPNCRCAFIPVLADPRKVNLR
ncbi:MAG: hypothetical protein CMK96_05475 [Pseudomonas sp.]|nr:hypothetical protein [Pseudomonas sp.]QDP67256.1 MAG: hypothetical protein GOVbin7368_47 [Prokaryotic dsDNA virus sp.]|tara:strand:+ start:13719 stop:14600 length:882 start_codon:yes stop_codon:yes gene_type:complete